MIDKILIVYTSKRGSTEKYANWIAKGLCEFASSEDMVIQIDCMPFADFDINGIGDYDIVIYGGWLRGSGIVGFDKIKSRVQEDPEKFIIYCCGISDCNPANYMQICDINFGGKADLSKAVLYYCPGAYDPKSVKGMDKLMMMFAKHILLKGKVRGEEGAAYNMMKMIDEGCDLTDRKYAEAVVKQVILTVKQGESKG